MSHTPKTPTPSYTTANLPTDLPEGSVVFDSSLQKLVSFKLGSWGTLGGVGSTTYVRDNVAGVIDQIQGDIPEDWKNNDSFLKGLVIGTSCTSIGNSAFINCFGFTGLLVIPDSVTTIGDYAFYFCNFGGALTIGSSVTSIGDGAFNTCAFSGSLTIPNSVTSIGDGAFGYIPALTNVNCYVEKSLLDVPICLFGTSVTTIHVRSTDSTWTAGAGQTIGGKTGITVIKDL